LPPAAASLPSAAASIPDWKPPARPP
jgi:hypothetical protein